MGPLEGPGLLRDGTLNRSSVARKNVGPEWVARKEGCRPPQCVISGTSECSVLVQEIELGVLCSCST